MIYLVEDDPDNAELVIDLLADLYPLRVFREGAELLDTLDAGEPPPAVFVLDLGLPRMDGYTLLRTLRDRPSTAGVPAIALTAHAMKEDAERAKAAGFEGYVTKPLLDETVLVAELQRVAALTSG